MTAFSPEWPPKTFRRMPLGFVPSAAPSELTLTDEQRQVASQLPIVHRALLSGVSV